LSWTVPYAPGALKAVATTGGKAVADFALRTAGAARAIALVADVSAAFADGRLTKQINSGSSTKPACACRTPTRS
jgi:hypothetical protein